MTRRGTYYLLLSSAIIVSSTAFYFSENYIDYDSITRSLMGYNWLEAPFPITSVNPVSSVFGPLLCYLGAIPAALGIHPDLGLRIVSLMFSLMTIVFAEKLARMLFGATAGLFAMVFIMFYSLWLRSAAVANSEAVAGALFIAGLYYLCLWVRDGNGRQAIFAGLLFMLLTATRYEFWVLLPPIILFALYQRRRCITSEVTYAVLLVCLSGAFAVFWLVGNYVNSGDPLEFIHGAGIVRLNRHMISQAIVERGLFGNMLYNFLFLPGVTFLSLGALATGAMLFLRRRHFARPEARLLLLAPVIFLAYHFITFVYPAKTVNLARYTYTFGLLIAILGSCGLVALKERISGRVFKIIFVGGILLILGQNIFYSRFATPSDNPMTERLRALSPISMVGNDVTESVAFARQWLSERGELTLDYRYSPQRLLFLKLYEWRGRITTVWPKDFSSPDSVRTSSQRVYLISRKSPYTRDKVLWRGKGRVEIAGAIFETVFSTGDYVFVKQVTKPIISLGRD